MDDILDPNDPIAAETVAAIRRGNVARLREILDQNPGLARSHIGSDCPGRLPQSLLHLATDWPGHYPNGAAIVATIIEAGADVNIPSRGRNPETPLHWAASSNDVAVLDALLDGGADIEAPGAVIGGGPPLADAVAFGQWEAARRLVDRGAQCNLWHAAALGLMDRLAALLATNEPPISREDITEAFWQACHGGQYEAARILLERGANLNWIGYDNLTPLDIALRSKAYGLAHWLIQIGAKSAEKVEGARE